MGLEVGMNPLYYKIPTQAAAGKIYYTDGRTDGRTGAIINSPKRCQDKTLIDENKNYKLLLLLLLLLVDCITDNH